MGEGETSAWGGSWRERGQWEGKSCPERGPKVDEIRERRGEKGLGVGEAAEAVEGEQSSPDTG